MCGSKYVDLADETGMDIPSFLSNRISFKDKQQDKKCILSYSTTEQI